MNDPQVRLAFHKKILRTAHQNPTSHVIDELCLRNGEIRADIAVLNDDILGYEIKTENDTLKRLDDQIIAYNEVFDKVFLVSGEKHVLKAIEKVPTWWGIYVVQKTKNEKVTFKCLRKAKSNREKSGLGIAQLLWKNEVQDILSANFNYKSKSRQTKYELYEILANLCSPHELGKIVIDKLKKRDGWRTNLVQHGKNDEYAQPMPI